MKNHAFLITAHKQPKLLARSLRVLEADNHYFFIHINSLIKEYADFIEACKEIRNVVFVKRIPIYHGTISQIHATLILIKTAKQHPVHFDYFHQISGQDYPLRNNKQFDNFFENTNDSFMCYNSDSDIDYWTPIYHKHTDGYHSNGSNSLIDRLFYYKGQSRLLNKLFPRKPIENIAGGWDWYSWSDKVVEFVLSELGTKHGEHLQKRFNYTVSPSELLFATLLFPHLKELNIRRNYPLRYVSWQPYRPIQTTYRPYNLNELDYEYVIKSPTFFCRKVDEKESATLLDMIDKQRNDDFDITLYNKYC